MWSTASSAPLLKPMPSCWSSVAVITPEWPRSCWGLSPGVCCITPSARWRLSRPRSSYEEEGSEMSTWNWTGPIVVEVDGNADQRVVDYAVEEALSAGAAVLGPWIVHADDAGLFAEVTGGARRRLAAQGCCAYPAPLRVRRPAVGRHL